MAERSGTPLKYKGRGKKQVKSSETDEKKIERDLKKHIRSLIDSRKDKNTTGRKTKGIRERLNGKDGQIQSNVAGKRVDFTARTVIVSGGSLVPAGSIGVPEYVSNSLTYPEMVTHWNLEHYKAQLKKGRILKIQRGERILDVKMCEKLKWKGIEQLKVGDVVERVMDNDDWIVGNRQPTLRLESMMGSQTMIFKNEYVFRLPLVVTLPYGADFDGDN